jgi:transcriptional regulator with XRE-family HTH domain
MTAEDYRTQRSGTQKYWLETGDQLHEWRVERGLTAKRLAELIEVTERSIHRAERGGKIGARIKLAMKLLEARIGSGEISLLRENQVLKPVRRRKGGDLVLREPGARYGTEWHGQLRSGADIRAWRKSVGLYVKELAELLGVVGPSMMRAERSDAPSSRIMYGVELLRGKVLSGEIDLRVITERRARRGRPKKSSSQLN